MDGQVLDELLTELAKILGEFKNSAVIGGGVALLIYRQYFAASHGRSFPEPAATKDIDMLLPRVLSEYSEQLDKRLFSADFERVTNSLDTPPVESYIGNVCSQDISIEFLTDRKSRRTDGNVIVAGVTAQTLSYIEMSRAVPLQFATAKGEKLLVVAPAAWMFHKVLTFPKRRSNEKKAKDLYGIWYLGTQLGEYSRSVLADLNKLAKSQPANWRKTAKKNIEKWTSSACDADWTMLEVQDPQRMITRANFKRFVEEDLTL